VQPSTPGTKIWLSVVGTEDHGVIRALHLTAVYVCHNCNHSCTAVHIITQ